MKKVTGLILGMQDYIFCKLNKENYIGLHNINGGIPYCFASVVPIRITNWLISQEFGQHASSWRTDQVC